MDVVVKREAVCYADHQMLLVKVKLGKKFHRRGTKDRLVKQFHVTRLQRPCQDARGRELLKGKFVSGVCVELKRS